MNLMKSYLLILLTLSVVLYLAITFLACSEKNIKKIDVKRNVQLKVSPLSNSYNAGDVVRLKLDGTNIKGESIFIFWESVLGDKIFTQKMLLDDMIFSFPKELCKKSGSVNIRVSHNGKIIARTKTSIKALNAKHKMDPFIGPKSIGVDHNINSMLVCYAKDKYGNPVENNTEISFHFQSIKDDQQTVVSETNNLIAYMFFENPKETKKYLIGANCGDANMVEQEIYFFNGPPENVSFNLVDYYPYADDRHLIHLRTNSVKDAYGNVVADGTLIDFIVKENNIQVGLFKSYTISGIANVFINNPDHPTKYTITSTKSDEEQELILQFEENIISCPIKQSGRKLTIGPVIAHLGQFVSDGTIVNIKIYDEVHGIQLDNGLATFELNEYYSEKSKTSALVSVGNFENKVNIEW